MNAFEKVIWEETHAPLQTHHRAFVRRQSLSRGSLAFIDEIRKSDENLFRQRVPKDVKRLLEEFPSVEDIRPWFRLTSRWQASEDVEFFELDEEYYEIPPLRLMPRQGIRERMKISFSMPLATPEGGLFYAVVDRGFLWGCGFFCRYLGDFAAPSEFAREVWWKS